MKRFRLKNFYVNTKIFITLGIYLEMGIRITFLPVIIIWTLSAQKLKLTVSVRFSEVKSGLGLDYELYPFYSKNKFLMYEELF